MADLPTLWHFRLSHYNEKARWALDWKRLPHRPARTPSRSASPDRVVDDGTEGGAGAQARRRDHQRLDPHHRRARNASPDPAPLSRRPDRTGPRARPRGFLLDEELGPHIRRVFFFHLLQDPDTASATLTVGEPALAPALSWSVSAGARRDACRHGDRRRAQRREPRQGRRGADTHRERAAALGLSRSATRSPWRTLTVRRRCSRRSSTRTSSRRLPPLLPPLAAWRASVAERPGFQWAAEMYRRHRGASAEVTT